MLLLMCYRRYISNEEFLYFNEFIWCGNLNLLCISVWYLEWEANAEVVVVPSTATKPVWKNTDCNEVLGNKNNANHFFTVNYSVTSLKNVAVGVVVAFRGLCL